QQADAKSVALRELQSTAQTYKSLYENSLQRYMESVQQQSFPISEARLISSASRPLQKSSPKTFLIFAIASLGGMILGLGLGLVRDMSDRVFRTSEQIENLLQTSCVGVVPLLLNEEAPNEPRNGVAGNSLRSVSDLRALTRSLAGTLFSTPRDQDYAAPRFPSGHSNALKAGKRTIVRSGEAYWTVVNAPLSRFAEAIRSIKLA